MGPLRRGHRHAQASAAERGDHPGHANELWQTPADPFAREAQFNTDAQENLRLQTNTARPWRAATPQRGNPRVAARTTSFFDSLRAGAVGLADVSAESACMSARTELRDRLSRHDSRHGAKRAGTRHAMTYMPYVNASMRDHESSFTTAERSKRDSGRSISDRLFATPREGGAATGSDRAP